MTRTEERALVIGYGHMGRIHARALRDLGYDVVTYDPAPNADADFRRPAGGCLEAAPLFDNFHVVCIATPIENLAEEAMKWRGFGGHLLIEKPAARSYNECEALRRALRGQRVAVGFVERFNPQVRRLKRVREILADQVIATTFSRLNDRPSSDVSLDLLSHDLDLARYLELDIGRCEFETRADVEIRRRAVRFECPGITVEVDLMAHDESPVHRQWRSFLMGSRDVAGLDDAVAVHAALEGAEKAEAA